jgi:acetyltransferase-like isoleucine patch superfamily enzyme
MHLESPFRKRAWPLNVVRAWILRFRKFRLRALTTLRGSTVKIEFGKDVSFAVGADVNPPHYLRVGNHVSFGKNFHCETDLTVGNEVLISSNVAVIGRDHLFDDECSSVYFQGRNDTNPVTVGDNVLIGYGAIIIGPAVIGSGCIIGAGSVVTKDLPAFMICGGVPARPIKRRFSSRS